MSVSQPLPQPPIHGPPQPSPAFLNSSQNGAAAAPLLHNGPLPPQNSQQQLLTQFAQQQGIPMSQQVAPQPPQPQQLEPQQPPQYVRQAPPAPAASSSVRTLDVDSLGGLCLSAMPRGEAAAQPLSQIAATIAVRLLSLLFVMAHPSPLRSGQLNQLLLT